MDRNGLDYDEIISNGRTKNLSILEKLLNAIGLDYTWNGYEFAVIYPNSYPASVEINGAFGNGIFKATFTSPELFMASIVNIVEFSGVFNVKNPYYHLTSIEEMRVKSDLVDSQSSI